MKDSQYIDVEGIGRVLFEHSSRARRIIITVRPRQGVRVAVPGRTSLNTALDFVRRKKDWINKHLDRIEKDKTESESLSRAFSMIDCNAAKRLLTARLAQLAEKHGFTYNRVTLRRQQTRWGSCSRRNNISLNLKLAVLPQEMIDYVILHELVHTRFHDHSKKFWTELDKYTGGGKAMAARLHKFDTRWI